MPSVRIPTLRGAGVFGLECVALNDIFLIVGRYYRRIVPKG